MNSQERKRALILAVSVGLILLILLLVLEAFFYDYLLEQKKNNVSEKYIYIEDRISHVVDTNFNILRGFSAYVQTNRDLKGDDIYHFLDLLFDGAETFIRNIGILEDTTITWNYPPEENQAAIGVDLAKVEGQSDQVLYVKHSGNAIFVGPINLVQGGIGYIIRMPIYKSDTYFGQISIVINGDRFIKFLSDLEDEMDINFKITDASQVIYESNYIDQAEDMSFVLNNDMFEWRIRIQPDKGWSLGNHWFTIIPFIILVISVLVGFRVYYIYVDSKINKHNAFHDPLTGLYNRHYLNKYSESIFKVAEINQYNIGIIVIDINNFKSINDQYGHLTGDGILNRFALKLKSQMRSGQEVFRIGGDEFLIIFEHVSDRKLMFDILERLKHSVEGKSLLEDVDLKITLSAGIAVYPEDGNDLDALYNIADQNMYIEKSK